MEDSTSTWPDKQDNWPADFLKNTPEGFGWSGERPERFWHICEQCGARELLTPQEAFEKGWDYPPAMGRFGVVSQRNCPKCLMCNSLYWRVAFDHGANLDDLATLTPHEKNALGRILMEPESLRDGREGKSGERGRWRTCGGTRSAP